jgi:hypothetical protein
MRSGSPFRPQQRHYQLIAVRPIEERTSPRQTFGLETNSFIGSTRSGVFRKYAEPNPIGVGILENALNEFGQKGLPVTMTRARNSYSFNVYHAFRRIPVADYSKPNRLRFKTSDEVSVTAVSKRRPMLRLVPAADELLVS